MRLTWVALLATLTLATPAWACRQALVLALDVSGSVDGVEYQQQVTGLAFALGHPEIRAAIIADVEQPVDRGRTAQCFAAWPVEAAAIEAWIRFRAITPVR